MSNFDNITPLRGAPEDLKPKAKALLAAANWAGDFSPILEREYLVKGWLDRGGLTVIYGPSNVGKSFLAIDLAEHISKGKRWGKSRVSRGNVLYIAAEGGAAFSNRVSALENPEFWVLTAPVTFAGKAGDASPLVEMLQHLASMHGKFDLIVVDTLSRVMGTGDENTAPDIADLLRNLDVIRRGTGSNVVLIHHTGKDATRGARGHSSLRAAIDTEIELTRDDWGQITAEVTKQRDGPTGHKFSYRLRQVELGRDQDGDPVTTCLVEPTDAAEVGRVELNGPASKALDILEKITPESVEGEAMTVLHRDWMEACISSEGLSTSTKRESHRRIFNREQATLLRLGLIGMFDNRVWIIPSD